MASGAAGVDVVAPDLGGLLLEIVGWVLDAEVGGDGEDGFEKRRMDVDDGLADVDEDGLVGATKTAGRSGGGVHRAIIGGGVSGGRLGVVGLGQGRGWA